MRRRPFCLLLPLVLLLPSRCPAEAPPHGLRVPPGFAVAEFAGSDLANDLFCLTLGPRGQVVVSGRGFVRLLADGDGDGRADRALDFAGAPKDGAMGLLWEGQTLWCVGDGGLRRYRDAGAAGRLRPPELVFPLKTGGEHDAHAVRRGPDGWLYLLCGNNTGVKKAHAALPTSPIKEPVAGCVLRRPPDRARDRDEVVALVLALRRLPEGKEQDALRGRFDAYLQALTGQKLRGAEAWAAWCVRAYPERAARLADPDGVDGSAWEKRLAALDWASGDAARGEAVFAKASCASCHSGAQALGPDLRGVAGRFSRADLFTAILRPSKDVPPRYRTTAVTTSDGKLYQGLIVYEAANGLILQTGPAATVRLDNGRIAERRLTATSLMPAGLLDRLADREIADLYAYLKSLGAAAKN